MWVTDSFCFVSDVYNPTMTESILSLVSTLSRSSLNQEQVTHHVTMLSSVQGSVPCICPHHHPALQSLARLSYHLTQFVRLLNSCFSQLLAEIVRN